MRLYICTLIYTHSVLVQFCIRSHGFSLVTSHSQYLNAGPRVQGTDNSASPIEAFAQRSTSPKRKSLKDLFLSSASMWGSDHKCLQEAHLHRPLPPLHLTPPPESEVWYSRLPPQQSWMDLQTGFCPGRGKEPYVQNVLMVNDYPKWAVVEEQRRKQSVSQSGDQRLECSCHTSRGSARRSGVQAIGCTGNLHFQEYPQEIPHTVNGRLGMMDVNGFVYSIPLQLPMLVRRWRSVWWSTRGWWRAMISTMESPCMSKRLQAINWQKQGINGREYNWRRRVLEEALKSTREDRWRASMLTWFWIYCGLLLYMQRMVVIWPHQDVQILCKGDILRGSSHSMMATVLKRPR